MLDSDNTEEYTSSARRIYHLIAIPPPAAPAAPSPQVLRLSPVTNFRTRICFLSVRSLLYHQEIYKNFLHQKTALQPLYKSRNFRDFWIRHLHEKPEAILDTTLDLLKAEVEDFYTMIHFLLQLCQQNIHRLRFDASDTMPAAL